MSSNLVKSFVATAMLAMIGYSTTESQFGSAAIAQGKPKIVASYSVLCDFLDTIAADTIDLTCLIEGGQDPHAFRPTPADSRAIEQAQVIFYGGYDFEPQIINLVEEVGDTKPTIAIHEAVVSDPIMGEAHDHGGHEGHEDHDDHGHDDHGHDDHGHDDHEHENHSKAEKAEAEVPDPHVWHDVNNAIAMVDYLQTTLLQLNPAQSALYLENSAQLREELVRLHPWIQQQVSTIPEEQRVLVTSHDALNYYVQAYEFKDYKQLQGLSSEDSPSASDVRELVQEIRSSQVPTIFTESTSSDRVIQTVAREAGVQVSDTGLLVDGLGKSGTDTDTYTKMMVSNTCAIVNGLGGQCQQFE